MKNDVCTNSIDIIQEVIMEMISSNGWGVGTKLPSMRNIAKKLGANMNTVHSAYKKLEAENIIVIKHGDGAYISDLQAVIETSGAIRDELHNLLAVSRLSGLKLDDARNMLVEMLNKVYSESLIMIAFIECNPYDLEGICNELMIRLPIEVKPLLIDDVKKDPALLNQFPIVCTTYYHIQEVNEIKTGYKGKVIALHHSPNPKSVHSVATVSKDSVVGLVASNEQTLDLIKGFLSMFNHKNRIVCLSKDTEELKKILENSNVIVTHFNALPAIKQIGTNKPIITIQFHLETYSIEYLRREIAALY